MNDTDQENVTEEEATDNFDVKAGAKMSFLSHLEELRKRLIISFIAIAAGFVIAFYFAEDIFAIMNQPLLEALPEGEQNLIYTGVAELWWTYLKVGLWGGIFLALPVLFYQLWSFAAPGLYKDERKYAGPFVVWASILFVTGSMFGFFIVFPLAFKFLLGFSDETIKAMPAVSQYFSFFIKLLFGFGLIFELPVVMVFLGRIGVVDAPFLSRHRKYAFLLVFVASAVLTPPDVISQILMAGPLIVLYEISIILVRIVTGKKKVETEEEDTADDDAEDE